MSNQRYTPWAWLGFVVLLLSPGVGQIVGRAKPGAQIELSSAEVFGLVERDLGAWLSLHAAPSGAVILAPPNETTAISYYSGLRGVGTFSLENKDGVAAAVRILSAPTAQEAKELIDRRGITHLVLLSWDTYFDDFARMGTGRIAGTFREQLQFSTLPLWLRPMAYRLPTIAGFEGRSATIFEVVEEQDEATALSRIAEYLVELEQLDEAAAVAQALRRFPSDLATWVARAEVELARGDEAALAKSLKQLQARLASKTPPVLPWDQRVGLAVLLARSKQMELAREQARLCIASADESKLRALSTGSLYRLLLLNRAFGLKFDPSVRELALRLLPADLRARVQ